MTRTGRTEALGGTLAILALLAGLGLASGSATAAEQDSAGALHLSADQGELDNAAGVSTYRGNVEVTRGAMRITGDELRVYRADGGGVGRIEVEGTPATFRDQRGDGGDPVHAEAPEMIYHAGPPERINLSGGAYLQRGRDEFRGETVRYDIAADRVEADSSSERRVEVTLHPDGEGQDEGQ
ncbi:lipopolysaccharide transport periplasmic protein LptA [Arhodomonas sp. SL1]|uniref:lipopolysaccharide transport periplasmic protein LptA n=1 Tax=Arhodomonas sp. SL1 TaxID=3425691 RepID=UPI003F882099